MVGVEVERSGAMRRKSVRVRAVLHIVLCCVCVGCCFLSYAKCGRESVCVCGRERAEVLISKIGS